MMTKLIQSAFQTRGSAARLALRLQSGLAAAALGLLLAAAPVPSRADDATKLAAASALPADAAASDKPTWFPVSYRDGLADSGAVALTFDDGPHPKLTLQLVEILRRENVPATFFLLGEQVERFPGIARQTVEAGFEIANHSYDHKKLTRVDSAELQRQIDATQDIIFADTGIRPTLFRAPYGSVDSDVRSQCETAGLDIVAWSIDPEDWKSGKTPQAIADKIVAEAKPGSIVVLHDIHSRSIAAVPLIIEGLRAKGLKFATAGDLIRARKLELASRPNAEQIASGEAAAGSGVAASPVVEAPPAPPSIPLSSTSFKDYHAKFAPAGSGT